MVSVDMGKVWRSWNYPKVLWAEMGKGGLFGGFFFLGSLEGR